VKTELLLNLQLILGTALLILLGVFTFVLINRIRQRRTQLVSSESSPPAFPYPSERAAEQGAGLAVQMQVEADALIPAEHARWLNSFFLPDPVCAHGRRQALAALPTDRHQPGSGCGPAGLRAASGRGPPGSNAVRRPARVLPQPAVSKQSRPDELAGDAGRSSRRAPGR